MALFCIFWWQQKIIHSLGEKFKCNWKIFLSKLDNQTNDPIFWTPSVGTFHFCILRSSKFSSMRSPLCFMFWSVKSQFYMPKMTISSFLWEHKQEIYDMLSRFWPVALNVVKGWSGLGWEGWVNPLIKGIFMKKACFK